MGVATDSSGNVLVAGYTGGGLDGNSVTGTNDVFVAKYDTTGTKLWVQQLGTPTKSTNGLTVTTDSFKNVYVAGSTTGGLDGNALTGTNDFFITKYTSSGAKQWTKQMGAATGGTLAYGIAMTSSGPLYVAGITSRGLDFNTLTGSGDAFVCQFIGN